MPKKKPRSVKDRLSTIFWIFGGIAVISGAIVGFGPAYSRIEPLTPALSYYVREYADKRVDEKVTPIQMAQRATNETLERILNSNLRRDLAAEKRDPSFNRNPTAQDRAKNLERQLDASDKRLDALEKGVTVGGQR